MRYMSLKSTWSYSILGCCKGNHDTKNTAVLKKTLFSLSRGFLSCRCGEGSYEKSEIYKYKGSPYCYGTSSQLNLGGHGLRCCRVGSHGKISLPEKKCDWRAGSTEGTRQGVVRMSERIWRA